MTDAQAVKKVYRIFSNGFVSVYGRKADNYWDVGAGYFQVSHGGVSFEMMGKRGNLTLDKLAAPGEPPTRILVGNVWARVHSHPGTQLSRSLTL
jgi:hypothetical protein